MKFNSIPPQICFKKPTHQRYNKPLSFLSKNKVRSTQTSPNKQFSSQWQNLTTSPFSIPQQSSSTLDQLDTNKSFLVETKASTSPLHFNQKRSNQTFKNQSACPSLKSSTTDRLGSIPLRSTLKNMQAALKRHKHQKLATQPSPTHPNPLPPQFPTHSSLYLQNKKLREQNAQLRQQLQSIKRNIIHEASNKNQRAILALREKISAQQLEMSTLNSILQSEMKSNTRLHQTIREKEEEIAAFTLKIQHLGGEITELRERCMRFESLKSKINVVFKMYYELQQQFMMSSLQWGGFVSMWEQEKEMYIHRINFLQGYIAKN